MTAILTVTVALLPTHALAALIFTTILSGSNEVPPNGSPGVGTTDVTLQDDMFTLDVLTTFSGLTSPAIAAHLHCCAPAGVNTPVRLPLSGFPAFTSGTYSHTFNLTTDLTGISTAAFITALESGRVYANIHTSVFPGGEIRGQLAVAVPEPSTSTLIASSTPGMLLGLLWLRRRKLA